MTTTETTWEEPSESWADLAAIDVDDGTDSPQATELKRLIDEGRILRKHRNLPTRRTTYRGKRPLAKPSTWSCAATRSSSASADG